MECLKDLVPPNSARFLVLEDLEGRKQLSELGVGQHRGEADGGKSTEHVIKLNGVLILIFVLLIGAELLEPLEGSFGGLTRAGISVLAEQALAHPLPERIESHSAVAVVNFFFHEVGAVLRAALLEVSDGFQIFFGLLDGFFGLLLLVVVSARVKFEKSRESL